MKPKRSDITDGKRLRFRGSIGTGRRNAPGDVQQVTSALAVLGNHPRSTSGSAVRDGWFDAKLHRAIQRFQSENGLEPDGWIAPQGATASRLRYRMDEQRQHGSGVPDGDARGSDRLSPALRPPLRRVAADAADAAADPKSASPSEHVRDEGVDTQWGTRPPAGEPSIEYEHYTDGHLEELSFRR